MVSTPNDFEPENTNDSTHLDTDIPDMCQKNGIKCAVEESAAAQEPDESQSTQPFTISETEWTAIKALLDKRYTEIAALLRYNKTKDESIQRLSAELQKYREGFAFSALKPFINALIALREDCRKSMRDAEQFALDDEKVKKYIEYLVLDIGEMLTNTGLERNENSISINGKPLSGLPQPKTPPVYPAPPIEPPAGEQKTNDSAQTLTCAEAIKNIPELIEYLNNSENTIRLALQDKTTADKTIQEYIALAARTDAEHYFSLVGPISRQVFALYDSISAKSQTIGSYSGGTLIKFYSEILEEVVSKIGVILTSAGVEIEIPDSVFDTKKHKLLKTVQTSDEKLDRTVANTYTDCYTSDGKVIYQSKVDIYKFQQI